MRWTVGLILLGAFALRRPAVAAPGDALRWRELQPGVRYVAVAVRPPPGVKVADQTVHLVKLQARRAGLLRLGLASESDRQARTAAGWAQKLRLAVTINLGMYQGNNLTHVGYLRSGTHVNSRRWVAQYNSLLAIDGDRATILDRGPSREESPVLVQNLRLIRSRDGKRGEATWGRGGTKRWSEAALAMDRDGNLLFIFTRVPFTMWELSGLLLSLPLQIVRAMHLEGGPEASLSIHAGGLHLDLCGSFETGFYEGDFNQEQFSLPNVLGVERR
jgi:hypothetical protein